MGKKQKKSKIRVGILGATGMVGQRFIQLLINHPWFEITALAASTRSAGKLYGQVVNWVVSSAPPPEVLKIRVAECEPELDCDLVFSGLPGGLAGAIEEKFARRGYPVFSNSKDHRMDEDVPLLIPEVNPDHIDMINLQQGHRGWKDGFIATNPNCSAVGLTLPLKPLHENFELQKVIVTTMQAVSGAGYPGVSSHDILDNVLPWIKGEEDKLETEPLKMLGELENFKFKNANFKISASCNRVNTKDGHLEAVWVKLKEKASISRMKAAFGNFNPLVKYELPSSPERPIIVTDKPDRPQPRYDRNAGKGMSVTVGRLRKCRVLGGYKFTCLVHNTIRGAAGGSILNAELMKAKKYL